MTLSFQSTGSGKFQWKKKSAKEIAVDDKTWFQPTTLQVGLIRIKFIYFYYLILLTMKLIYSLYVNIN